jgi:AcrR family transcriptional regulator
VIGQKVAGLFRLASFSSVRIIDRRDNNVPKDGSATRATILAAAVHTLQRGGVEGFSLDAIARRAGVVKGLILYHYASRQRLLRAAASHVGEARDTAIARALASGPGTTGLEACWEVLRRQTEDGTTRAWLSLCAAGLVDRSARNAGFETAAQDAIVDGCAAALAAGVPLPDARDAYDALCLSLLEVTERR